MEANQFHFIAFESIVSYQLNWTRKLISFLFRLHKQLRENTLLLPTLTRSLGVISSFRTNSSVISSCCCCQCTVDLLLRLTIVTNDQWPVCKRWQTSFPIDHRTGPRIELPSLEAAHCVALIQATAASHPADSQAETKAYKRISIGASILCCNCDCCCYCERICFDLIYA